jgi:hypothetical protein
MKLKFIYTLRGELNFQFACSVQKQRHFELAEDKSN